MGPARHLLRRLHPHHRAPPPRARCRRSCRRSTTTATSTRAPTRASTAWPARRTTPRPTSSTGNCPIHGRPVEYARGGQLVLPAVGVHPAAARLVRGQPRRGAARRQAQRGARHHPPGPRRRLDHPHVDRLGRAGAVGRRPRLLRLVRRAHQLRHRRRLRRRPRALRRVVAGRCTTSSARTSCGSTACTGRRCCWPRAIEPPPQHRRARLPARRRREDEQDRGSTRSSRPTWSPTSASTASATTSCATARSAPTATSPTRAWSPATTPTSPTTSATCCRGWPRSWPRSATASARRPRADSPLAAVAAEVYADDGRRRGTTSRPSIALEATWRLIREANAHLEANEPWKLEPGPEVDARDGRRPRGAAHRRHPGQPGRAADQRRGSGAASACAGSPDRAAPARRRGVGRLPGRPARSRRASRCSPGSRPAEPVVEATVRPMASAGPTTTATCPADPATRGGAGRGRGDGRRRPADHRRQRRARLGGVRSRPPAHHDGVWATAGVHPHDAKTSSTTPARSTWAIEALLDRPEVVAVGECGLDYHYDHSPRDAAARGVRRPDRAGPRARPAARDPHPRGVGRHVRHPRRRGRARAHGLPLLHRRARRGPARPRPRRLAVVQRHRHVPVGARACARRRRCARSTGCWSRPTRPTWRPCPHRGRPQPPAPTSPLVGAAVARGPGVAVAEAVAEPHLGQRRGALPTALSSTFATQTGRRGPVRTTPGRISRAGNGRSGGGQDPTPMGKSSPSLSKVRLAAGPCRIGSKGCGSVTSVSRLWSMSDRPAARRPARSSSVSAGRQYVLAGRLRARCPTPRHRGRRARTAGPTSGAAPAGPMRKATSRPPIRAAVAAEHLARAGIAVEPPAEPGRPLPTSPAIPTSRYVDAASPPADRPPGAGLARCACCCWPSACPRWS